MRNFKLVLAYDGTDYCGWQVQPESPSIQGTLASAIGRVTGEKVLPQGSGRTDAGVHALGQVATFALESVIPAVNLRTALNDVLPAAIRVLDCADASQDFHARRSAIAKTYRYRMYRGDVCPPFLARYVWHYPYSLDFAATEGAAPAIEGEHDFTSFAAVDPERGKSPWRRGVLRDELVLVCPACQESGDWTAELESCSRCASVHLIRRLGQVECLDCGLVREPVLADAVLADAALVPSGVPARAPAPPAPLLPASAAPEA